MEKTLKELDVTWSQMEFDHEKHHHTGIMLINASEELIETLEDNQVHWLTLLSMYGVCQRLSYFRNTISEAHNLDISVMQRIYLSIYLSMYGVCHASGMQLSHL